MHLLLRKKRKKASTEKNLKEKLKMDELADMKCQRHSISYTIDALNKDVKKYSFKVEDKKKNSRRETEVCQKPRLYNCKIRKRVQSCIICCWTICY